MRLQRYILFRLAQVLPVAFVIIIINFALIHLAPGDVSIILAGEDANPEYMAAVRERYGLDLPLPQQLLNYLMQIASGDLGLSYRTREPVLDVILERVPATLLLAGTSLVLAAILGTAIGAFVARRPGSALDTSVTSLSISLFSIPVFWLGLMLILLFAVKLRWFPSTGMVTVGGPREGIGRVMDIVWHMVLPVLALATVWLGQYVRLARASVADVLAESYVTTGRAIGFSEPQILMKFGLRNALLPIITVLGLEIGVLLTGAVLTETVFSWPGLGRLIYEAILARDTPIIMGAFIIMSFTVMIASLVTDVLYAALDPRVKL
ncbi:MULTISPECIES: ABC transporter permease [unclassified Chelatococcus]|jgi:peptide/nickel transport system permease protein|uniref:ABC transporter permease n=1 Tax=unclassified Chelatococcus TaxID=2638111 RepID=UPI001BCD938E|nr:MULTISPECIES: ABC transporter permease [unclassified Chelatococcus]CAH1656697.1 putative dipeptide transport system permease protein 1 [Hyphomicrobiales bacterium]MBS7742415.1 ABC transporter permease [Chelatococcus sp. HY11]MBX3542467.1 ABC transporter permease [Chelatococcus sp.]MCO5075316.1 ABC transporter permease [Chelatococcus sp.]CAH1695894.1 putative dipeptide transport system permease protein 1 [Hyphomicrobiales bacterium]